MDTTDPQFRYAMQSWDADGVRTQYDISFSGGYIRQQDVQAYSVLITPTTDPDGGLQYDHRVETLTFLTEGNSGPPNNWKTATVQILPAVETGRRVFIYRNTQKSEPLVDYSDGSVLTKANLDLANDQAIFGIAEIVDGLAETNVTLGETVDVVIDTQALINEVYNQVIALLNSSGIIGVKPQVWDFTGADGTETDFFLPGSDLPDPSFYDVYVARLGQEPTADFTIIPAADGQPYGIRLATPLGAGVKMFVVLRGSAKPYDGGAPITSLRTPVISIPSTAYFVDFASEFALLRATSSEAVLVTINSVALGADPKTNLGTGSYFSVTQRGSGQATIASDGTTILVIPAGCIAATRGAGSVISAICEDIDTNTWVISGDLAKAS